MTKIELFRDIYKNHVRSQNWLDEVPREINQAFFDNPYVDNLNNTQTLLIRQCFGQWAEAIEWFLYEWSPGMVCSPGPDLGDFLIYSIDQYIMYLQKWEDFPDD